MQEPNTAEFIVHEKTGMWIFSPTNLKSCCTAFSPLVWLMHFMDNCFLLVKLAQIEHSGIETPECLQLLSLMEQSWNRPVHSPRTFPHKEAQRRSYV